MRVSAFELLAAALISVSVTTAMAQSQKQRDFEEADKADRLDLEPRPLLLGRPECPRLSIRRPRWRVFRLVREWPECQQIDANPDADDQQEDDNEGA